MHEDDQRERQPRVVLVDDYRPALTHLAELLPMYDVEVVGTTDRGDLVLEALRLAGAGEGAVDVVVMDVRLPGRCGLDVTRQVRADFPAVQVILHSAYGEYLDAAAKQAGAAAAVPKGARPDALVRAIHAACGVTGEPAAGPAGGPAGGAGAVTGGLSDPAGASEHG